MSPTFKAVDPRTGRSGASYEEATRDDVLAAATAAAVVHRSGDLSNRAKRARLLRDLARRLRNLGDEIVGTCEAETGLSAGRLTSELERTGTQLDAFAALVDVGDDCDAIIDHPDPQAQPIPRPDVRRMRVALGPVAVFGASNFPLAFSTAGGDTASALAAGCPVIVKAHPSHPGTSALVARELSTAVARADLPEATFTHLQAARVEIGEALVDAPELAAVGFTGSFPAGRALFDRAARRPAPIPVYAEMGSINPIVVTEAAVRARAQEIANGLAASVSNSGGQLCTKPGVVFLPAGPESDSLAADVSARLDAVGPCVLLNERLRDALREAVGRLAARAKVRQLNSAPPVDGPGFRHQPAAFEAPAAALVQGRSELLQEHFGPIVLFLRYDSQEELLTALAQIEGQLTGSVHAEPGDDVGDVVGALRERAGRIVFNGFPTGVAVTFAMQHGGPFPASTNSLHTSVGMTAVHRFTRPVAYQDAPENLLPLELHKRNPLGIRRRVDGLPLAGDGGAPRAGSPRQRRPPE